MNIKTVTILGANGTMGRNVSAIFASFGHAKVYMICRTKEKAEKAVIQALQSIRSESINDSLITATYEDLKECISSSDLIFESLSEDFETKKDMYERIKPYLKDNAIIATGTSGLSITRLAKVFEAKSNQFFGIHMFNPPYNLTLCELITHSELQKELANKLEDYLIYILNRTVVRVKDTPSFLGNRIGFYFINEAMKLAEDNQDQGGIDYIDSILGCFTGRNMSPLATADFVGLDVTKSIVDYIYEETNDDFCDSFESTDYLNSLVANGELGRKVNKGLYYYDKDRKLKFVYDIKQNNYRLANNYEFYFSNEMIKNISVGNYKQAILILLNDESHEAKLCKTMLLKYIIYSLKISYEVTNNISSCDDAMATGFSWIPPISLINLLGGISVVKELSKKYLDNRFNAIINDKKLLEKLPDISQYDYRPYLKAKY